MRSGGLERLGDAGGAGEEVERAEAGEEIVIGRAGRPVARLVPFDRPIGGRQPGLLRGRISARNSLIAASVGASCQYETLVTDLGGNLATDDSCQGFGQATLAELALAPLADNGGPTWTHALKPGSAAIDSIAGCDVSEPVASHDQRGVARPVDGDGDGIALCDVGAYEANDLLFGNGF